MQSATSIAQPVVFDQIPQLRARLSAKGMASHPLIRTADPSLRGNRHSRVDLAALKIRQPRARRPKPDLACIV